MKIIQHMKNVQLIKSIQHMKSIKPIINIQPYKTINLRRSFKVFEPQLLVIFFTAIILVEIFPS